MNNGKSINLPNWSPNVSKEALELVRAAFLKVGVTVVEDMCGPVSLYEGQQLAARKLTIKKSEDSIFEFAKDIAKRNLKFVSLYQVIDVEMYISEDEVFECDNETFEVSKPSAERAKEILEGSKLLIIRGYFGEDYPE